MGKAQTKDKLAERIKRKIRKAVEDGIVEHSGGANGRDQRAFRRILRENLETPAHVSDPSNSAIAAICAAAFGYIDEMMENLEDVKHHKDRGTSPPPIDSGDSRVSTNHMTYTRSRNHQTACDTTPMDEGSLQAMKERGVENYLAELASDPEVQAAGMGLLRMGDLTPKSLSVSRTRWTDAESTIARLQCLTHGITKMVTEHASGTEIESAIWETDLHVAALDAEREMARDELIQLFDYPGANVDQFSVSVPVELATPCRDHLLIPQLLGSKLASDIASATTSRIQTNPMQQICFRHMRQNGCGLTAVSLVLAGSSRVCLCIEPNSNEKFIHQIKETFQDLPGCSYGVGHEDVIFPVALLDEWKIGYRVQICRPGELIYILPGTFYQAVDLGCNAVEFLSVIFPGRASRSMDYEACSAATCGMEFSIGPQSSEPQQIPDEEVATGRTQRKRTAPVTPAETVMLKRRRPTKQNRDDEQISNWYENRVANDIPRPKSARGQKAAIMVMQLLTFQFFETLAALLTSVRTSSGSVHILYKPLPIAPEGDVIAEELEERFLRYNYVLGETLLSTVQRQWLGYHLYKSIKKYKEGEAGRDADEDIPRRNSIGSANLTVDDIIFLKKLMHQPEKTIPAMRRWIEDQRKIYVNCGHFNVGFLVVCLKATQGLGGDSPFSQMNQTESDNMHHQLKPFQGIVERMCIRACNLLSIAFEKDPCELQIELGAPFEKDKYASSVQDMIRRYRDRGDRLEACFALFNKVEYPKDHVFGPEMRRDRSPPKPWDAHLRWPEDLDCPLPGEVCSRCDLDHECRCMSQIRSDIYRIRFYGSKGRGLEACVPLRQSTYIGQVTGTLRPVDEKNKSSILVLSRTIRNKKVNVAVVNTSEHGNCLRLINSSHNPNVHMVSEVFAQKVRVMVQAIRDIEPGEELTANYGDEFWAASSEKCCCGEFYKLANGVVDRCGY